MTHIFAASDILLINVTLRNSWAVEMTIPSPQVEYAIPFCSAVSLLENHKSHCIQVGICFYLSTRL